VNLALSDGTSAALPSVDVVQSIQHRPRPDRTRDLGSVIGEVGRAGIERPSLLALTKFDDADAEAVERFGTAFPGLLVVTTSVLDDASLARLKAAAWQLTGLIRIYVPDGGDPFALPTGSTVLNVAAAIRSDLVRAVRGAASGVVGQI
jgi:ribosome-interacting GTPase 1